jgi:two-component system, OmpR family, sensor kinase
MADTPPVLATLVPGHLEQILDNLLANAVEASPPGKGIEVGIIDDDGIVTVHVRDHGPGLSDQERSRAFDRFWQGGTTPTGLSGLGLAIVQQLAAANGATVRLEASDGGGLDAVLCLPAAESAEPHLGVDSEGFSQRGDPDGRVQSLQ